MPFIASWNVRDMWFSARSEKTTEYSSRPSGSTFGSRPGTIDSLQRCEPGGYRTREGRLRCRRHRLRLAIARKPFVDERDDAIDRREMHALLRCRRLHETIDALDIRGTRGECARGGRRPGQPERGIRILFERHEIAVGGAERLANLPDPRIDGARRVDVAVHGIAGGLHRVALHAAIISGQQHAPLGKRYEHRIVHPELH